MSAKSAKLNATKLTATASTPDGELQKHLRALNLDSVAAYRQWCREQGFGGALDKPWQERRREIQRAEKLVEDAKAAAALHNHWWCLHFRTAQEYAVWCERHGFVPTGAKTAHQRKREVTLRAQERAAEAFQKGRRQARKPAETLEEIYHDRLPATELTMPVLQAIQASFADLRDNIPVRRALLLLLQCAQRHTDLIDCAPVLTSLGAQKGNTYISALLALAHHHTVWLRAPEDWRPATHNAHRLLQKCLHNVKLLIQRSVTFGHKGVTTVLVHYAQFPQNSSSVKRRWIECLPGWNSVGRRTETADSRIERLQVLEEGRMETLGCAGRMLSAVPGDAGIGAAGTSQCGETPPPICVE